MSVAGLLRRIYVRFFVDPMPFPNFSWNGIPFQVRRIERRYDPATGGYRNPFMPTLNRFLKGKRPEFNFAPVEREVARFYQAFIQIHRPQAILETGVYRGYATTLMAAALEQTGGGRIFAIDPLATPHFWDGSGLRRRITWIPKMSQDALGDVRGQVFDLLVLDSAHTYDTVSWELIHFERLLRPHGFILLHDCLFFDGVGMAVSQLIDNGRFRVCVTPTPRTHRRGGRACSPGLAIVQKLRDGEPPLVVDHRYLGTGIGDPNQEPFLLRRGR